MNTAVVTVSYGQRVTIARERWTDDTRAGRLALAPVERSISRWGAVAPAAVSSSATR